MVELFDKVQAVGVGHSWWKEQFCAGSDETSIDIVMTELENTVKLYVQVHESRDSFKS